MSRKLWTGIFSGFGLLLLILDGKTGIYGASEGLRLCMQTLIPSLFPFFFLSILLTGSLSGTNFPFLRPLGRLCGIPKGAEMLFVIGLLGGYPSGAQCVAQSYEAGQLSRRQAGRMLGFCSNAGPSFLFGIIASRFGEIRIAWMLWLVHILSAVMTAALLPGKQSICAGIQTSNQLSLPQVLKKSLSIMAQICGWVIISRVIICFLNRWVLWLLPAWLQVCITGILELANGCIDLSAVTNDGLRFVICCGLLSFGGICVLMQTISVTGKLGLGMYLPGKLIQTGLSVLLSCLLQHFLFAPTERIRIPYWFFGIVAAVILLSFIYFLQKQKNSSNSMAFGV